MNKVVAFAFISMCLALASHAQLSPLPPSSTTEGIVLQAGGANQASWQSSQLKDYQLTIGNPFQTPANNASTDIYGRTWTNQAPGKSVLNNQGGSLRMIFLGNGTNWDGAVGYTYSGSLASPTDSFTVANASSLNFGDHVDINMGVGIGSTFDLWATGGVNAFSLFQPSDSLPSTPNGSVSWTLNPLMVSTYLPALNVFQDVETWIASIDENTGNPANPVLNYRVAVQFYYPEGNPLVTSADQQTPVPEASTYGLTAGAVLILLTLTRRHTKAGHDL